MNHAIKNFIKEHQYFLISIGVLIISFMPTLMGMWNRWFARDSYYSHGWLIPLVTIYLIWDKRAFLRQTPANSSAWGMAFIIIGVIAQLISSVFRINFSSGFALMAIIFGLVLHFYGKSIFRKLLFPLFFLFFMVPLPSIAIVNISFKMKILAAKISTLFLNYVGFKAVQFGSIIRMNGHTVIVDDVCSGLRSLISLMALGSICAFWFKAPMYKRVILFLMTIPISIVTNVFRIVSLSLIGEIWGAQAARGFVHDAAGFLVFVVAFILLYATGKLIE